MRGGAKCMDMKTLSLLLGTALALLPSLARAAEGGDIKGLRLEPATTKVALIGKARLSVDPLTRGDGGLHAPYKVDVSGLPTGSEHGQFKIAVSGADFDKLAAGQAVNFSGQAVSSEGNQSSVHGTATPSGKDGGAIKVKVDSKKGKLVFNTTYKVTR